MKLCFNQATTMKHSTLEQDLALCEKHGYDLIEIRLDKLEGYLTRHRVADLAAFFRNNRLKPYGFNALECVTFLSDAELGVHLDRVSAIGEIGQAIGCSCVVVVPSFDVVGATVDAIRDESVRVLHRLADVGEPYGLRMAYEFIGYPNCTVNTFGQAYDIVRAVARDSVGVVLDCFHFHAMNSCFEDLEGIDPEKLFAFHVDDSEALPPGALRDSNRVWPGEGAVDLDRIVGILKRKGYDGMASLELFNPSYWEMETETVIRTGKDKLVQVLRNGGFAV